MTLQNIYIQVLLIMRKELHHRLYELRYQQLLKIDNSVLLNI